MRDGELVVWLPLLRAPPECPFGVMNPAARIHCKVTSDGAWTYTFPRDFCQDIGGGPELRFEPLLLKPATLTLPNH